MAVTGVTITNAVAGDDFDITRTVTNIPAGQTLAQAWLTIKTTPSASDTLAVVQKIITTTPTAGQGHITDDGADGSGVLLFTLTGINTRAIFQQQTGSTGIQYDIQIRTSANKIYTLETGTISMLEEVTLSNT
jgi:hypothetical protein